MRLSSTINRLVGRETEAVCVCVYEKENQKERQKETERQSDRVKEELAAQFHDQQVSYGGIEWKCVCVCVRERERERERER